MGSNVGVSPLQARTPRRAAGRLVLQASGLLGLLLWGPLALGQRPAPPPAKPAPTPAKPVTPPQRPAAPKRPTAAPGATRLGQSERGSDEDEGGPAVLATGDVPQDAGTPGDLPPRAERIRRSVASVALDNTGRSRPEVVELVALPEGFGLLFSDERDGARSYLLQRLSPELGLLGEVVRLDDDSGGLGQGSAALAAAASGAMVSVWLDNSDRGLKLRGRVLESAGVGAAQTWSLPLPQAPREARGASDKPVVAPSGPQPALVWTERGGSLAWYSGGRILLRDLDPRQPTSQRADILGTRTEQATSGPRLAADSSGALACAFDAGGSISLFLRQGADGGATSSAGAGSLVEIAADTANPDGGWWLLARRQGQLALRHLARSGGEDRPERRWLDRPWSDADLVVGAAGPCVLVQFTDGALRSYWFGPNSDDTPPLVSGLRPDGPGLSGETRAAVRGEVFAFAWNERGADQVELKIVSCRRGGEQALVLNSMLQGDGSAVQEQPVAAFASDRGVIAWTDHRNGDPRVVLRGLDPAGALGAGEFWLPAAFEGLDPASSDPRLAVAKRPAIALQPSGRGVAAWIGSAGAGATILTQAFEFGADGEFRARSPVTVVDGESINVPTQFRPAIIALAGERSFALVWVRPVAAAAGAATTEDGRSELRVARLGSDGAALAPARTIASGPRLARPCLAQLDDGRIAVAWELQPHVGERRLAARVLSPRCEPDARVLYFETMWRNSDYAPSIAPAAGGFAMAWTSGEELERDVFARAFDFDGRPLSRPLALTPLAGGQQLPSLVRCADGSFAAVWQDDLSRSTRLVGRRLRFPNATAGPWVRFPFGSEPARSEYATPQLLALPQGGLLLVGGHALRGKGREIGLCEVGGDWDHVEGR